MTEKRLPNAEELVDIALGLLLIEVFLLSNVVIIGVFLHHIGVI